MGTLEMPMAVGLIGGAARVHPAAKAAIKILGVKSAIELAEVMGAVGLAQNVAALRALAAEGIQRGHMKLHPRNMAASAARPAIWSTLWQQRWSRRERSGSTEPRSWSSSTQNLSTGATGAYPSSHLYFEKEGIIVFVSCR